MDAAADGAGGAATAPVVVLDGAALGVEGVRAIALGEAAARVDPAALAALAGPRQVLLDARDAGAVYGANTGVGANRHERLGTGRAHDPEGHGLRILRSHAAAAGPEEDDATARAAMVVRLNQLLAGGSGTSPAVVAALAEAVESGAVPRLHRWGGIGTGDIAPLAELGLTLAGELPWRSGGARPAHVGPADAIPLISSSAVTVATAVLAAAELRRLLRASVVVTALSFLALGGATEALDDAVHRARPHPAQVEVAAALRRLVAGAAPGSRLQDPFGLRVAPQVLAPALHALAALEEVLAVEVGAPAENPLVTAGGVRHHGQFHAATLATALDTARAALHPVLTLCAARLGLLMRPEHTGLRPFLADGPAGSSGLMIAEYVVQDVLAELRPALAPTTAGALSISLGVEEHASFATQGARALRTAAEHAPVVVAAELVAAVRALRMRPERLGGPASQEALERAGAGLDDARADAPLGPSLARAVSALGSLDDLIGELL